MSSHAHDTHAPHAGHGPHRNYVKIWAILLALLIVSVLGPMIGIRAITIVTAFGIALVKAYMVAKNFMHLDIEKPFVHWMLFAVLALMVLLWAGVAPDVQKHEGQNWKKPPVATAQAPHHEEHGGGH